MLSAHVPVQSYNGALTSRTLILAWTRNYFALIGAKGRHKVH